MLAASGWSILLGTAAQTGQAGVRCRVFSGQPLMPHPGKRRPIRLQASITEKLPAAGSITKSPLPTSAAAHGPDAACPMSAGRSFPATCLPAKAQCCRQVELVKPETKMASGHQGSINAGHEARDWALNHLEQDDVGPCAEPADSGPLRTTGQMSTFRPARQGASAQ